MVAHIKQCVSTTLKGSISKPALTRFTTISHSNFITIFETVKSFFIGVFPNGNKLLLR